MLAKIIVGSPRKRESLNEVIGEAERVNRLLNDPDFGLVMTDTADVIVREWSEAPSVEAREAARSKLDGLQAILKHMQVIVEQGVIAARRQAADNKVDA